MSMRDALEKTAWFSIPTATFHKKLLDNRISFSLVEDSGEVENLTFLKFEFN